MMDRPELNPLLRGVKFSPEDIDEAIINVIDEFNTMSPPTQNAYTVETFPFRSLLLKGISGHLLRGASINQGINQLDISVDGVQVNDFSKAELFMKLGNAFWEEFKQSAQQIKINQNVAQAFGSIASEYSLHVR